MVAFFFSSSSSSSSFSSGDTSLCTARAAHAYLNEAIKSSDGTRPKKRGDDYCALLLTEVYNGACEV